MLESKEELDDLELGAKKMDSKVREVFVIMEGLDNTINKINLPINSDFRDPPNSDIRKGHH